MEALTINTEKGISTLSDRAVQLFELGRMGANNSQKAYASDWLKFSAWCLEQDVEAMPALPTTIANYIAHLSGEYKPATINRHIATIAKAHKTAGLVSPTSHPQVKIQMNGIEREQGTEQKQAKAFDAKALQEKITRIDDSMKGLRDKALLLVGFTGAFRRSELASLTIADLDFQDDCLIVRLSKSKTNQLGRYEYKALFYASNPKLCPVRTLKKFLALRGELAKDASVFVSVMKGGKPGASMSDKAINDVAKARIGTEYSAHSLRASFVTVAKTNGASDSEIMQQTKHKTVTMVRRYTRISDAKQHNAAMKLGI